jgi:hypothetical protein
MRRGFRKLHSLPSRRIDWKRSWLYQRLYCDLLAVAFPSPRCNYGSARGASFCCPAGLT